MSGAVLRVARTAITANALRLAHEQELIAVVKADGFGLGAATVASAARDAGAQLLGVATLDEARALLAAGVADSRTPALAWLTDPAELVEPPTPHLEVALPSRAHLDALLSAPRTGRPRRVHLFVDTGMSRDGCPITEWPALCAAARRAEAAGAIHVVGVMGHLGCSDPRQLDHTLATRRFATARAWALLIGLLPERIHLAATAACLDAPEARHHTVRVGTGLAGIDPTGRDRLTPVAELSAPVVQVRRGVASAPLGCGTDAQPSEPTWLGLLPLGYADGLPRAASGRAEVQIDGRRHRLIGEISMDQVVVDLGPEPVPLGTPAVIFGAGTAPRLGDWARWAGTIEHEVLTGIGARVRRDAVQELPSAKSGTAVERAA